MCVWWARLKQAPPVVHRLQSSAGPGRSFLSRPRLMWVTGARSRSRSARSLARSLLLDRCGDGVFSRAGPKLRQARDGHSRRMGPLFSFCPRAPRLSSPPVGGVWKSGVRPLRPDPCSPAFCASRCRRRGVPGVPLTRQMLWPLACPVSRVWRGRPSSPGGREGAVPRPAPSRRCAWSSRGAPGAFRVCLSGARSLRRWYRSQPPPALTPPRGCCLGPLCPRLGGLASLGGAGAMRPR